MTYPSVMSEADTIRAALAGRSLARFGDGELKIATGRNAKSQAGAPDLAKALRRVLLDTTGPCLPCIPRIVAESPKADFWNAYTGRRYTDLYRHLAPYGSSLVTRPDSAPWINDPAYWALVRDLWRGQEVVVMHGGRKGLHAGDMPEAASVVEIEAPVRDAWIHAPRLMERVRSAAAPRGAPKKRVILCLGATATAMAYLLAQEGLHVLDLGHMAMFLRKLDAGQPLERLDEDRDE